MSEPAAPKTPVTENDIKQATINYLAIDPRVKFAIRMNSGSARKGKAYVWFYRLFMLDMPPSSDKVSDIIGMLRDGRFFAFEVKKPGEIPTEGQREFMDAVKRAGGVAGVVYHWHDAKTLLDAAVPLSDPSTKNPPAGQTAGGSCPPQPEH